MTAETNKKLNHFFAAFSSDARPLLLLDYDGTLAPFRVDRFQALPWTGVRELLNEIQGQGATRLVMITGRPASEIVPLLGLDRVPEVWGLHGVERLHTNGKREIQEIPTTVRRKLDDLRTQLRRDALGGLLEEKHNSVVLHWRGVPQRKAQEIEARARQLFEPLAQTDGLILLDFEAGLELRAGRDKGGAVRAILEETSHDKPRPIAYLGDDLTDEAAFCAINDHGLSILVRRQFRETAAEIWLRPPGQLRDFLKKWLQACKALDAPEHSI